MCSTRTDVPAVGVATRAFDALREIGRSSYAFVTDRDDVVGVVGREALSSLLERTALSERDRFAQEPSSSPFDRRDDASAGA